MINNINYNENIALEKELRDLAQAKKVRDDNYVIIFANKKKICRKNWFIADQNAMIELARLNLKQQQYRVLCFLLGLLNYENEIHISQKSICEELQMDKGAVSRTISYLSGKDLIRKTKRDGRFFYRLNPHVAWKGKEKNRKKIICLEQFRQIKQVEQNRDGVPF